MAYYNVLIATPELGSAIADTACLFLFKAGVMPTASKQTHSSDLNLRERSIYGSGNLQKVVL